MSSAAAPPKPAQNALARLDALAHTHTEWVPWLGVLRELLGELSNPAWEALPPHTVDGSSLSPQLAGAELRPDGPALASLLQRLSAAARAHGLLALAGPHQRAPAPTEEEARAVFLAAVNGDEATLERQALRHGATPEGWRALAQLLPMPYLHACARSWAARPHSDWAQGYCPVCGAWPAFAELRGIERARHLRCGRCGSGWPMPVLAYTYCATTDHYTLGGLVVNDKTARWAVDVCQGCSGYLKAFTTLQPTPSNDILASDLSSVEFDLIAIERGFLRPPGPGVELRARLAPAEPAPAAGPALVSPAAPRRWWS
jgi:FdhE protein